MVKLNKIEPQIVEVYHVEEGLIGKLNQYEFNDLRVQICREQVIGYFVFFNERSYPIDANGRISGWPKGLFDLFDEQLEQLLTIPGERK